MSVSGLLAQAANQNQGIFLLEPIGGVGIIPTQGNTGLGVLGYYFAVLYPWLVGVAAGIAVLRAVWSGVKIIQSGADAAEVGKRKNELFLSLGGLLIILLSATILNALNPVFFR